MMLRSCAAMLLTALVACDRAPSRASVPPLLDSPRIPEAPPPPPAPDPEIARLVQALRSALIEERDAAQRELVAKGPEALATMRLFSQDADPDLASRARAVLDILESLWPVGDGFWWEFADGAGTARVTLADPVVISFYDRYAEPPVVWQPSAWVLRNLWPQEAYLIQRAEQLEIASMGCVGFTGLSYVVPFYAFDWARAQWEVRSQSGCVPYSVIGRTQGKETVRVPAGEFSCKRIAFEHGLESRTTFWLSPGVGPVKIDFPKSEKRPRRILELRDYHTHLKK